jgi:putative phosphoesterase
VDPHWLDYLAGLPGKLWLTYGGTRILVAHGAPWDDPHRIEATYVYPTDAQRMRRMRDVDADVVILGHTHVPVAQREGGVLVVNPGSCGVPDGPSGTLMCAALDVDTGAVAFRPFQLHQNGSLRKER